MFNHRKYLYKQAQLVGLVDAPTTSIGSPPQEPPVDEGDNGDEDFYPDGSMIAKIFAWAGEKGTKEVGQDVIQIIVQTPPHNITFSSSRKDKNLFVEKGIVDANFLHILDEDAPQWFLLENNIRNKLLASSIWKYIGVPYERGFLYMQNGHFMGIVTVAILEMSLNPRSLNSKLKEAAFWVYEESDKYLDNIKNEILNRLGPEVDKTTLKIQKLPKSSSSRGQFINSPPGAMLYSQISFLYEVAPWKYEQKSNAGAFLSLLPNQQKSIMTDLFSAIEDFETTFEKEGGIEAIISMSGRSTPSTPYQEEGYIEVTDVEYYPGQVEHFIELQLGDFDILKTIPIHKLGTILQSIPPKLMHLIYITADIPGEVEERYKAGKTMVTTQLLLDHADITNNGKLRLLIVPVEKDIK